MDKPIMVVCGWCGRIMEPGDPEKVSHGICRECYALELEKLKGGEDENKNLLRS